MVCSGYELARNIRSGPGRVNAPGSRFPMKNNEVALRLLAGTNLTRGASENEVIRVRTDPLAAVQAVEGGHVFR